MLEGWKALDRGEILFGTHSPLIIATLKHNAHKALCPPFLARCYRSQYHPCYDTVYYTCLGCENRFKFKAF